MAQPLDTVSMPQTPETETKSSSDPDIKHIRRFDTAFELYNELYKKKTKKNLKDLDLFKRLENCDSPAAILAEFQSAHFDDPFQTGVMYTFKDRWLLPILNVLGALSIIFALSNMLETFIVTIDSFLPS